MNRQLLTELELGFWVSWFYKQETPSGVCFVIGINSINRQPVAGLGNRRGGLEFADALKITADLLF
jgi:hypothetical protein